MTHTSVFSTKLYPFFISFYLSILFSAVLLLSFPPLFSALADVLRATGTQLTIKPLEAKTLPATNRNPPWNQDAWKTQSSVSIHFGASFCPILRCYVGLPSPHQRPSGHRLNLAPGYPSSTLRNKRSSTKREDAKNQKQMSSPKENFVTQILHKNKLLGRSVCVFSGPKKTWPKKDVQQIFSPVYAETKKLSFFLSDFLLGFGNGRLERLMRFTGLRGHHPPDKPKPNYPPFWGKNQKHPSKQKRHNQTNR